MSETLKLRTTAFGGFQRQDVVDYIEQSAREHAAQLNALRAELKQAQESLATLEGEKARADALAQAPFCAPRADAADELRALMEQILEEEAAFTVKHLAINGRDIMALGVAAGPEVGRLLDACLDAVIDERVPNEREELLAFAEKLRRETS